MLADIYFVYSVLVCNICIKKAHLCESSLLWLGIRCVCFRHLLFFMITHSSLISRLGADLASFHSVHSFSLDSCLSISNVHHIPRSAQRELTFHKYYQNLSFPPLGTPCPFALFQDQLSLSRCLSLTIVKWLLHQNKRATLDNTCCFYVTPTLQPVLHWTCASTGHQHPAEPNNMLHLTFITYWCAGL